MLREAPPDPAQGLALGTIWKIAAARPRIAAGRRTKLRVDYDHIISIGGNCDVAHHVRRRYDIKVSMPLDWLVLTFDGAISLFNDGFRDFMCLNKLSLWNGTRHAFQCSKRGIVYQHDFSRDAAAMVVVDNLREGYKVAKLRYKRRIERLFICCSDGKAILFIRSWREILHTPLNYPERCIPGVQKYRFPDLMDAIERCFPDIRFQVLFINYGEQEADDPRAVFANVKDVGDVIGWTGSTLGWNQVPADYQLKRVLIT